MNDRSKLVGTELARFTFTVERGKIRELALAVGDDNPLYTDPAHARVLGYRDVIAPPTFGTCIELWGGKDFAAMCKKMQLNPVRVLHGEQEYSYFGDIYPGDELEVSCLLKDYADKGKMYVFYLETTFRDRAGKPVLMARHTVIERK